MLHTSTIPSFYKPWITDTTLSSQIKSIYKKLKETDVSEDKASSSPTAPPTIMVGSIGEVYIITQTSVSIYDWLPSTGQFKPYDLHLKHTLHHKNALQIIPVGYNRKLNRAWLLFVISENNIEKFYLCDSVNNDFQYFALPYQQDHVYVPRLVDSGSFFVVSDVTTNETHIFQYSIYTEIYLTIPTTVFDIKGDYLIYKSTNKQTTTKLSISSNKKLANKLLNAMVDIVKDLKDGTADYKEILIDAYNTITKQTEYVECIDLPVFQTLFRVGLPSGISNLSLAPNDLKFISISNRGDELLKWDFSQLQQSNHVLLTDRHTRGQTATTINSVQVSNNHILCVNSITGSIHYLGNYGWKLPKLRAKDAKLVKSYFIEDFIVIVDMNNDLLIANMAGKLVSFIKMDQTGASLSTAQAVLAPRTKLSWKYEHMELDVDTCGAYPFIFLNKHYTFTKVPNAESITPSMLSSNFV